MASYFCYYTMYAVISVISYDYVSPANIEKISTVKALNFAWDRFREFRG